MNDVLGNLPESHKMCLRLVARGMSSKEIARETGLTPQTVDTYLKTAMSRLGAPNRREAARSFAEWDESQKLGSPPHPVAAPAAAVDEPEASGGGMLIRLIRLPPLGGGFNDASWTQKTFQALWVAVVSAAVVIALALAIAGLFETFR